MKKILLLALFAIGQTIFAQDTANECINAYPLCGALGEPFLNTIASPNADPLSVESYGCLGSEPNPAWFYMPVSQSGDLNFLIEQYTFGNTPIDVDFICWGPFTGAVCGPEFLNTSAVVDCSYSASSTEEVNIPGAVAGEYYMIMVTNFSNQAGLITIMDTNSQGALDCSGINLNAFLDANANGVQDVGEMGFPLGNFVYEANNDGNVHTVTSFNGSYTIYDEVLGNTYDFQYDIAPEYTDYYTVATPSYTDIPVMPGNAVVTYNFPVTITTPYQDLAIYTIPVSAPPVPGFTYIEQIVYSNLGNQAIATGSINYVKELNATITTISDGSAVLSPTGFDLPFTNLQPFETRTFTVTLQTPVIPDVNLDDAFTSTVTITPLEDDATPENNTSVSTQVVVGSYDPNDIIESRGRDVLIDDFTNDDYLYYRIRFQNTGTASALNVSVDDVLDPQLDQNTVEMLYASHDFVLDRQDNHLVWTFNHILLPAEQDNEEGSHGYIYFRVKPVAGFAVGDIIPNDASIYFDFNPAIVTNTFETHFMAPLSVVAVDQTNFSVYPNPAKDNITIALNKGTETIASVKIYDVTGKTLYTNSAIAANSLQIDSTPFAPGTYFVEITGSTNTKTVKKLLKQ
ncbi:T9SS type A sorting domain-containing protein [Flavobacterium subsaxonicum]|uniref:T9SS type A sorting domain-containing protein n=1 Tax=Flavobacterium subsaxonicum TaxID=426226 RepID=UPI00040F7889|nr:T9SS type A sorting domain-containing protein [Flavobacterium subsaxonicum]